MRCVRWNLVWMLSSGKALGSVERGGPKKTHGASAGVLSTLGIGRLMEILSFRLVAMCGMLLNITLFMHERAMLPSCRGMLGTLPMGTLDCLKKHSTWSCMWWVGGHQTVCVMLSCALCALTLCQVTYGCFVTGDVARSTHTVPLDRRLRWGQPILKGICRADCPRSSTVPTFPLRLRARIPEADLSPHTPLKEKLCTVADHSPATRDFAHCSCKKQRPCGLRKPFCSDRDSALAQSGGLHELLA